MSKKINHSLIRKICLALICVSLLVGAVGVLFSFKGTKQPTQDLSFKIGGINEDGTFRETARVISSKDLIECMGLDIKIAYGNNISYRVFFYDSNKEFLCSTGQLTTNYGGTPELARYCRIEIRPYENVLVRKHEISKYAEQLEIIVDEEQNFVLFDYFEGAIKNENKYFKFSEFQRKNY